MSVAQTGDSRTPSGARPRLTIVLEIESSPVVRLEVVSEEQERRLVRWLLDSGIWDELVAPALARSRWKWAA